jgi:hypothetical protein
MSHYNRDFAQDLEALVSGSAVSNDARSVLMPNAASIATSRCYRIRRGGMSASAEAFQSSRFGMRLWNSRRKQSGSLAPMIDVSIFEIK